MNGINMLGDINNVSDLLWRRSALFRATDSNWGGILPYNYAFYARLRSGVDGSYDVWLAFNGNKKFKFARVGDNNIPESADWVDVAIATPPQEFDLRLVKGYTPQYTHSCIYYKTQETIVGVNVALIGEIPANSDVIIGTLPAGFRPKATCWGVAGSHFSPYGVGSVSIDENGNINVRFTAAQVRCNFTICFLAAD